MKPFAPLPLEAIRAAQNRLQDKVIRTPAVRLNVDDAPADIWLKLELLQPIGSFKLRGAGNAMLLADADELARGVWTTSAGNMAQGVAWHARRMGIPCSVVVPEQAPEAKLSAIRRLGGRVIKVPYDTWMDVFVTHEYAGMEGLFVHPVSDAGMIAGNGTIGLEILEQVPDVDAIVVPFGGGGLSGGIASAVRALRPDVPVYAGEVETAAPLAASLEAGERVTIDRTPSFVDGIGAPVVLEEMWPLAREVLAGSLVVSLKEVTETIRLLVERNHVVAEGAGAVGVAAALAGQAGAGTVVCVVSGGNIDTDKLVTILEGGVPPA